jgi:hypothetical protein
MAKKSKALAIRSQAVEVLPASPGRGRDPALERMIEQKIAEMMDDSQDGIFQPFFQSKAIEQEIRKLQTVPQKRKWHYYFEDWGCLICESKDRRPKSLGMCATCFDRVRQRLAASLRRAEAERPEQAPLRDLQDVAREALRPTQKALPAETRSYVTKAERKTERKAQREAEWQRGTARRENRADRVEALRLAVEQGLTAREIAEKYDPDFLKNPEAATQRIQAALYRYVPPAVRAQRKHERSAHREEMLRQARHLHEKGLTWREIAELLDPEGFAMDPKAAMARIITGVRWLSQRARFKAGFRNEKGGSTPTT